MLKQYFFFPFYGRSSPEGADTESNLLIRLSARTGINVLPKISNSFFKDWIKSETDTLCVVLVKLHCVSAQANVFLMFVGGYGLMQRQ